MFAIATTLIVLDLVIEPSGTPWERAVGAWPFYLAYVVSFLTIGAAWLGQPVITDRLAVADFVLLKINLLLLLVVAVLPFSRPRGGEFQGRRRRAALRRDVRSCLPGDATPAAGVDAYARRAHLSASPEADAVGAPTRTRRSILAVVVSYTVAILVALLAPAVAVGLYCAIAIVLVVPWSALRLSDPEH